jgi:hypothetical protein
MQTPTVTLPSEYEYDGPESVVFDTYDMNYTGGFTLQKPLNGIAIGVVEIALYLFVGYLIRQKWHHQLKHVNIISYYWLLMTVLTFIWEVAFICQYKSVHDYAEEFVQNDTHVWTTNYTLSYVNPWKLSKIFYAEYGAHADREYIQLDNYWSRLIEGTHAGLCGLFALLALIFRTHNKRELFVISATVSMSTQLMNSILYMGQYFYQVFDPHNVNYPSSEFPFGPFMLDRGFMYVNLFWTLMPLYVIVMEYCFYDRACCKKQNLDHPSYYDHSLRNPVDDLRMFAYNINSRCLTRASETVYYDDDSVLSIKFDRCPNDPDSSDDDNRESIYT